MWSKKEKKTQDSERIINSEFELQFERAILWSDPLPTYIWTGSSRKTLFQMKCGVVLLLHHMFVLPKYYGVTLNSDLTWKRRMSWGGTTASASSMGAAVAAAQPSPVPKAWS